jgi:hypothetical protein
MLLNAWHVMLSQVNTSAVDAGESCDQICFQCNHHEQQPMAVSPLHSSLLVLAHHVADLGQHTTRTYLPITPIAVRQVTQACGGHRSGCAHHGPRYPAAMAAGLRAIRGHRRTICDL